MVAGCAVEPVPLTPVPLTPVPLTPEARTERAVTDLKTASFDRLPSLDLNSARNRDDQQLSNTDYFEAVRIAPRQLQSETDEHQALRALISAHSEMMHAIGLDVFPDQMKFDDVDTLPAGIPRIIAKGETSKEIELPSETSLDLLVNAMLQGGEAAPGPLGNPAQLRKQRRKKPRMFEVRVDVPEESPPDSQQEFSAIVTASGGPMQQQAIPLLNDDLPDEGGEPGLRDGGDGEGSPEQEAFIASQQEKQKFVVHLAVFRSESKARQFRRSLTEPEAAALHGVDVRVAERPTSKGKSRHHVEIATVADWATARDLCATLKSFRQSCIPATR
jgi:hypothetical protein